MVMVAAKVGGEAARDRERQRLVQELAKLVHLVRLIAPAYVKPFIKRQKSDAADA